MAGYNYKKWKSNNAVVAEANGLMTLTALAKALKVKSKFIKENCETEEWHHTSKFYNRTNYYDYSKVKNFLNSEEGQAKYADWIKTNNYKKNEEQVYETCRVKWTEWSGSKNKSADTYLADNVKVVVRGGFATVSFPVGTKIHCVHWRTNDTFSTEILQKEKVFRKSINGKYFEYRNLGCFTD